MEYLTDIGLIQKAADCRIHQWAAQEGGVISQVGDAIEAQYGHKLSTRAVMLLHERICLRGRYGYLVTYVQPSSRVLRPVRHLESRFQDVQGIDREMVDVIAFEVVSKWRKANSSIHQWAETRDGDIIGEAMSANHIAPTYRRLFDIALIIASRCDAEIEDPSEALERFYTQFFTGQEWIRDRFDEALAAVLEQWPGKPSFSGK